jgi:hypothetical protein
MKKKMVKEVGVGINIIYQSLFQTFIFPFFLKLALARIIFTYFTSPI